MLLGLLWLAVMFGAAVQAYRAWGGGAAVGTLAGLFVLGLVPLLGTLLSIGGAVYVGYRAENRIDGPLRIQGPR